MVTDPALRTYLYEKEPAPTYEGQVQLLKQIDQQVPVPVTTVTVQPAPTIASTPYTVPETPLERYVTEDNQVNLVEVAKVKDEPALEQAREAFGSETVDRAVYLAKTPVTQEIFDKLTPRVKEEARVVKPLPVYLYNKVPDISKPDFYIEAVPVKADVAARLGESTLGKTAFYQPSVWESVTPWAEEKGEKATTANVLRWEADIAIPFVYLGTHWNELSNREKGLNLALDTLIIGAIAYRPLSKVLTTATNNILKNSFTKHGSSFVTKEIRTLNKAVKAKDPVKVKQSGQRLSEIGQEIGSDSLVGNSKYIISNADDIAKGRINLTSKVQSVSKKVKSFVQDEAGEIGRYRIKSEREMATEQIRRASAAQAQREAGTKTARIQTKVLERPDLSQTSKSFWDDLAKQVSKGEYRATRERELKAGFSKYLEELAKKGKETDLIDILLNAEKHSSSVAQREYFRQMIKGMQAMKQAERRNIAAEIVRRAKENEERVHKMAEKALKELRAMKGGGADILFSRLSSVKLLSMLSYDIKSFTKALSKTSSDTQTKVLTRLKNLTNKSEASALSKAVTQTKALTKAETDTLTKLQNKTKTMVAVAAKVDTMLITDLMTDVITDLATDYIPVPFTPTPTQPKPPGKGVPVPTPIPIPRPTPKGRKSAPPPKPFKRKDKSKDKDKKRKHIYPDGTVTWRMGKLRNKPVWHILEPPYTQSGYSILVSDKPPKGVKVTASGRVAETIQEIGGKLGKDIKIDIGAFDMHLIRAEPKPLTKFYRDIKGRTRSQITAKGAGVSSGMR